MMVWGRLVDVPVKGPARGWSFWTRMLRDCYIVLPTDKLHPGTVLLNMRTIMQLVKEEEDVEVVATRAHALTGERRLVTVPAAVRGRP